MASDPAPALPWGSAAASVGGSESTFDDALRKIMLLAALGRKATGEEAEATIAAHRGDEGDGAGSDAAEPSGADTIGMMDLERSAVDIKEGERIEVRWQLTDEAGTDTTRWWGAQVEQKACKAGSSDTCFQVKYDAYDTFEEEEATVDFLSQRFLADSEGQMLAWRRPGDDWEPEEEEGDDDEATVGIHELGQLSRHAEATLGCSVEQAAMQEMKQRLTLEQQRRMALGFNDFAGYMAEALKSKAQERVQQGDAANPTVITADDIHEAVTSFKRSQMDS